MDRMGAPPGARARRGPGPEILARSAREASSAASSSRGERVARGARRPVRAARARAPMRSIPMDLIGITVRAIPRSLTGFAGILEPGCSCTPEGPRSFCEISARPVFTDPALSPPVRLL